MAPFRSYVICTSPRSGSTLLCKLLTATGIAGNPDSYFHTPSIDDWLRKFDLTAEETASEQEVLSSLFTAAQARGSAGTGIFGLRLQRDSFDFFTQQAGRLNPGLSNDAARFQAAFGKTLFIHLTRTDKIDQAISFVKATRSGLWHRASDGTELERLSPPQEPDYDAAEIARKLSELTALDEEWEAWFTKEEIAPLRITYDEVSVDPIGTLARVLKALRLDPAAAKGVEPATAKLADATSMNWKERFLAERLGAELQSHSGERRAAEPQGNKPQQHST